MSGIQHFSFCPRQWALIHIEQQWGENRLTAEGEVQHARAHDASADEKRGNIILTHAMPIRSARLGVRGICDVVEFHRSESGVPISGREGRWHPVPVEYKHGGGEAGEADSLQLCAQAMCLEDMLCCEISEGCLFYAQTRHRARIALTEELRERVFAMFAEMHRLYARGYTPRVKKRASCKNCSLATLCLPVLERTRLASAYIADAIRETEDNAE